jgi:hypothetical protein
MFETIFKSKLKEVLISIGCLLLFGLLVFFLAKYYYKDSVNYIPVMADTIVVNKYINQVKTVKEPVFIDRIITKYKTPETIYQQKVDSIFIQKLKYIEPMLSVKKNKNKITIYSYNGKDTVLKEYTFDDVGNSFDAISDSGKITVRSPWIEFDGVDITARGMFALNKAYHKTPDEKLFNEQNYYIGLKTGFTISKFQVQPAIFYDVKHTNYLLQAEVNYKIIY